jgi:ferric iron reductase protein FhuF
MYACSPFWSANWVSESNLEMILSQLSLWIKPSPHGADDVNLNCGLHLTGGEPFLNFKLLARATGLANDLGIPSLFVETNCFWCVDDEDTREKLKALKEAGLKGILISVNPFILEQVPFERTKRAVRISEEIFGSNTMIYQEIFYHQFRKMNITDTMSLEQYLEAGGSALRYAELLPMGRTCYKLEKLFEKYSAKTFFGESCSSELSRNWHVHIDNYLNYMTGYCGGISLGKITELDFSNQYIELSDKPILRALVRDIKELYDLAVKDFNYKEREEGYVSKCHLCIDIRRHIVKQTDEFKELQPRELYYHLE